MSKTIEQMAAELCHDNDEEIQKRIARLAEVQARYDAPVTNNIEFDKVADERAELLRTSGGIPLVGLPCSYVIGSDQYAAIVVRVSKSGHQIYVRTGHDGPDGELFCRGKDGRYRKAHTRCGYIIFLKAETRLDESF